MVFSTSVFVFAFLPATLAVYYITPHRFRNLALFIVSLAFYGWGEPKYIALMLFSIATAYAFGFPIERNREKAPRRARTYLIISLALNLAALLFFKYYNFFASNFGFAVIEGLKLPVGISFYTFQIMSYTIDLYRGDVPLAKRIVPFGTYVTLFPQLIAGPIVRYRDVCDALENRRETVAGFASGVSRFTAGLAKKLILGDSAAAVAELMSVNAGFGPTALGSWVTMLCYTLHIYFDFSGYSDMAIGLGRMFGFEFTENFNYPYIAKSVTDFWRRWHITLSTWFREYVYFPLGGSRRGKLRTYINLAVVWFLTGFWHGADWNYIIWGVYFWVFLVIEKAFLGRLLAKTRVLSHVWTMLIVGFGWIIFFRNSVGDILEFPGRLLGLGIPFTNATTSYDFLRLLPFFAVCCVACTPLPKKLFEKLSAKCNAVYYLRPVIIAAAFLVCVAYMVNDSFSPFLYYIF